MATWQNTGVLILRTMLDDAGCNSSTYTHQRLEELLIVSAYFIVIDINFSTSYSVNIENSSISPNPISQSDGPEFINFMVLKAACIADESAFRNKALLQGVTARCGPAVLNTSNYGSQLKDLLLNGPCKTYEELKTTYNFSGEGGKILRAVMSPFTSNDFYPPMGGAGNGMLDTQNGFRSRHS